MHSQQNGRPRQQIGSCVLPCEENGFAFLNDVVSTDDINSSSRVFGTAGCRRCFLQIPGPRPRRGSRRRLDHEFQQIIVGTFRTRIFPSPLLDQFQ